MAGRTQAAWKGMLKVGLALIPCRMIGASDRGDKVSFHMLHEKCHQRVNLVTHCTPCNVDIQRNETVKGYEYERGKYVTVSDDELKQVEAEASAVLAVTTVTSAALDPMYVDGTLLLVPEPAGVAGFETLRVALGERLAIGEVVIRSRTHRVALRAASRGFVVFKLRAADQVRTFDDLDLPAAPAPAPGDLALAEQLFALLDGDFAHEDVTDDYTTRLRALIDGKVRTALSGEEPVVGARPSAVTPAVSSLTDALRASLAAAVPSGKAVKVAATATTAAAPRRRRAS